MGRAARASTPAGVSELSRAEPIDALLERLHATREGLGQAEAARRLAEHGPNEIVEKQASAWRRILGYFWGPIPWMIEAAAALSVVVRHWADVAIIVVLLVANGGVAFWEESTAGNAIAALRKRLSATARVCRDGSWRTVPAREVVAGDVVRVRIGDIVPADCTLLEAGPVELDQSALTGESLPVERGEGGVAYSGSIVRRGESDALVFATGRDTFFGRTAALVAATQTKSHLQRALLRIGNYLIFLAVGLVAVIVLVSLFRGDEPLETTQFALVLIVASIPVAMPTVLSVTLAVGARMLAARQAVVARLASIEELAGVDVLCSDKTGTLTQNALTLGDPTLIDGSDKKEALAAAALASREQDADQIDKAILDAAAKAGAASEGLHVTAFTPFDPVSKRTEATVRRADGGEFKVSKGAPQVIGAMGNHSAKARMEQATDAFAERGFRTLGVAQTGPDGTWRVLAALPLFDPPREDSRETLRRAAEMGVPVKMVTGDQMAIAKETARELGMGTNILDAEVLREVETNQAARVEDRIETADGFAQVFPEDKHYVIDTLQRRGHIVAMTGDGVNDAPALKKADVGVAVSGATDAARAAAAIVLLAPGLSVIIESIAEARKIFRRMVNYAIYRIAETVRVVLLMALSIVVFNFYPVTAVMIVLLAVLNDGAILAIAFDRVQGSERPERWDLRSTLGVATALGFAGVVASFGLFYLAERVFRLDHATAQTMMYLKLSVAGHLTVFVARTRGPFWSSAPSRILVLAVIGTQALATLIASYGVLVTPIGWKWTGVVWAYALLWLPINDGVKLAAYRLLSRTGGASMRGREAIHSR